MIPGDVAVASDVYKAGVHCASMWRVGNEVTFRYASGYDGPPVASTLPLGAEVREVRMQAPAYFAGLLPEGQTRRRTLARALHVSEDDELGLLTHLGADTIGDVRIVEARAPLSGNVDQGPADFGQVRFSQLWLPDDPSQRSAVAGVQPEISYHSRSLVGSKVGRVILKFSPDDSWHGVLRNEQLFMTAARGAGLDAPNVHVVADADGVQALAVTRFDRSWDAGTLIRHAQEDATQVLSLRPAQKCDPDARTVIAALSQRCTTPVYDVVHTWPYEEDHRFHPAVRSVPHDAVTRKHWLTLATDDGVPAKVAVALCTKVVAAVSTLIGSFTPALLDMPEALVRDARRRVTRRVGDLEGRGVS